MGLRLLAVWLLNRSLSALLWLLVIAVYLQQWYLCIASFCWRVRNPQRLRGSVPCDNWTAKSVIMRWNFLQEISLTRANHKYGMKIHFTQQSVIVNSPCTSYGNCDCVFITVNFGLIVCWFIWFLKIVLREIGKHWITLIYVFLLSKKQAARASLLLLCPVVLNYQEGSTGFAADSLGAMRQC